MAASFSQKTATVGLFVEQGRLRGFEDCPKGTIGSITFFFFQKKKQKAWLRFVECWFYPELDQATPEFRIFPKREQLD
jgi:hypothetical protein